MSRRKRYHVVARATLPSIENKTYTEEKGIKYFFHTAEKGHNLKHIHASCQGSATVIGLEEIVELVPGRLRPVKKQCEAREFVAAHQQELIGIWDSIVCSNAESGQNYSRQGTKMRPIWIVNSGPSGLQVCRYMLAKRR